MIKRPHHAVQTVTAAALASLLSACGDDPTTAMQFTARIKQLNQERLELITTVKNFSDSTKTLSDIDIDDQLHKALGLSTATGTSGEWVPIDNTYSYTVNKDLKPGESFTFSFFGTKPSRFITGDIDFIVNGNLLNFRSIPVSCCDE